MGTGITRPKRLVHLGSDGVQHSVIFKGPNDDMRQDATMMQLFCVINSFLDTGADMPRNNRLKLRTYGVVPLSQRCGMLQMVPHTTSFNAAVTPLHQAAAAEGEITIRAARSAMATAADADKAALAAGARAGAGVSELPAHLYSHRLKAYNHVCSSLLPKFRFWFLSQFRSAAAWHAAVCSFRDTLASSSIAGYVAGVGDRHTSNILLDTRSGQLVHIDFGVVFEAGKLLPTPETIPFRLTRDLLDGLGPMGVEGGMRLGAEQVLQAIRDNRRALCTVAGVMIHDPLFSWTLVQQQDAADHEMAASVRGS
jgi:ataxia telangiectasia mutated family protein